jgi:hypothetical protein
LSDVLERLRVEQALFLEGMSLPPEEAADSAPSALPLTSTLATGMGVRLEEGVLLQVLRAPQETAATDGAVLRLSVGEFRLLLTSEIEQETRARLLADGRSLWVKRCGASNLLHR